MDRFSLHRFSLGSGAHTLSFSQSFASHLNAVVGSAVRISSAVLFGTDMQAVARGTLTVPSAFDGDGVLSSRVTLRAEIRAESRFTEIVSVKAFGVKYIFTEAIFADALHAASYAGKEIPSETSMSDMLRSNANVSIDLTAEAFFSETLYTLLHAMTQETETVSMKLFIPPGAEIRIDSDTYQVFLDGENVLYAQSGDWVHISRELLRLDIESAGGGTLAGSLVYTERYL